MNARAAVPALTECWVNVYSVGGKFLPGRQWPTREAAIASPTPLGSRLVLRLHAKVRGMAADAFAPVPTAPKERPRPLLNPGLSAARALRQDRARDASERTLDAYAASNMKAREIAVALKLSTNTVQTFVFKGRRAGDERVLKGDALRQGKRAKKEPIPQRILPPPVVQRPSRVFGALPPLEPISPPPAIVVPVPVPGYLAPAPSLPAPAAQEAKARIDDAMRDLVLNAYAGSGDYSTVLAKRLELRRDDVVTILAQAKQAGDIRIAAGDRRSASKRTVTKPAPPAPRSFPAAVPPAVTTTTTPIPAGRVLAVSEDRRSASGPWGTWGCAGMVGKVLEKMADGQLYGAQVLVLCGWKKGIDMGEVVRYWRPNLEKIGVRLVEVPKTGFRIERMG